MNSQIEVKAAYGSAMVGALPAKWRFCAALVLTLILLRLWPGSLSWLRLDRVAVESGQWWRLWSAHLVHLNLPHLLQNLLGLVLVCELLWRRQRCAEVAALMLAGATGASLGLLILLPGVAWYAGLSAVLHALWAGLALQACFQVQPAYRVWPAAALLALALKLVLEACLPNGLSGGWTGMPVLTASHAFGALSGVMWTWVCNARISYAPTTAACYYSSIFATVLGLRARFEIQYEPCQGALRQDSVPARLGISTPQRRSRYFFQKKGA